ncbi:hypothetical protein Tco_0517680 [Tanacetum coccineum]
MPMKQLSWKSPFEALHGTPPSYDTIKTIGCLCYAASLKPHKDEFDPRDPGDYTRPVEIGLKISISGIRARIQKEEMKQTLKPWFEMNPTTVMVDEGKEHAKTEDPHEDVGKLEKDGDKAVVMIVL